LLGRIKALSASIKAPASYRELWSSTVVMMTRFPRHGWVVSAVDIRAGPGEVRGDGSASNEKPKIVLESLQAPRRVSATARRYGVPRSMLLQWRAVVSGRDLDPQTSAISSTRKR